MYNLTFIDMNGSITSFIILFFMTIGTLHVGFASVDRNTIIQANQKTVYPEIYRIGRVLVESACLNVILMDDPAWWGMEFTSQEMYGNYDIIAQRWGFIKFEPAMENVKVKSMNEKVIARFVREHVMYECEPTENTRKVLFDDN